jgi:hypothetical protein
LPASDAVTGTGKVSPKKGRPQQLASRRRRKEMERRRAFLETTNKKKGIDSRLF